jgi:hypothetical protein
MSNSVGSNQNMRDVLRAYLEGQGKTLVDKPELQYQPNLDLDLGTARANVEYAYGGTGLTIVGATGQVYVD